MRVAIGTAGAALPFNNSSSQLRFLRVTEASGFGEIQDDKPATGDVHWNKQEKWESGDSQFSSMTDRR